MTMREMALAIVAHEDERRGTQVSAGKRECRNGTSWRWLTNRSPAENDRSPVLRLPGRKAAYTFR